MRKTNTTTGYYTQEEEDFLFELSKLRDRVRTRYARYPIQIEVYHLTKELLCKESTLHPPTLTTTKT